MARGRRHACDTTTSKVVSLDVLKNPIFPTLDLTDSGRAYFEKLIASRERASWSQFDIHMVSQCAQIADKIDELQEILNRDGWVMTLPTGVQKAHPAAGIVDQLMSRQLAFMRMLGLSASQRGVSGGNQSKRNAIDRDAQAATERANDSEGILA